MYNQYRCKNCNDIANEPFVFCKNCGHKAEENCSCGAIKTEGAKFCTRCGEPFATNKMANPQHYNNSQFENIGNLQQANYNNMQNTGQYSSPMNSGYNQQQGMPMNMGYMPDMAKNNPYMDRYGAYPMPYNATGGFTNYIPQPNRYIVTPLADESEIVLNTQNGDQSVEAANLTAGEKAFDQEKITTTDYISAPVSPNALDGTAADNIQIYSGLNGDEDRYKIANTISDLPNQDEVARYSPTAGLVAETAVEKAISKRKKRDNRFLKLAFVGFWSLTAVAGVTILIGFVLSAL